MRIHPKALWLGALLLGLGACGGTTGPADVPELRLVNTGEAAITLVNISPCNQSDWGANRTDRDIRPGQNREFQLTQGCYDLRVGRPVSGNLATTEKRGVLIQNGVTYVWEVAL